jgi:hypothetical protein
LLWSEEFLVCRVGCRRRTGCGDLQLDPYLREVLTRIADHRKRTPMAVWTGV